MRKTAVTKLVNDARYEGVKDLETALKKIRRFRRALWAMRHIARLSPSPLPTGIIDILEREKDT